MKYAAIATTLLAALFLPLDAVAWHIYGYVVCDRNTNGDIDVDDSVFDGVIVNIMNQAGTFSTSAITGSDGQFQTSLPDFPDSYVITLDASTLPADGVYVIPGSGQYIVQLTDTAQSANRNFLIDSAECQVQEPGACWMTGGGVKFVNFLGEYMAERGPRDSLGGNVFPSCSPEPGDGGQWNHVAHSLKLHFQGFTVNTVRCGNVPGIEPGSESPVTPFNFIEFEGTGRLKGIKGNKFPTTDVNFFGRVEDRNEPGSNGAKDGEDIDRYFLHVFEGGGPGTTHLLIDVDGDPTTVDPITITGGNLQLHNSSCDDPPNF